MASHIKHMHVGVYLPARYMRVCVCSRAHEWTLNTDIAIICLVRSTHTGVCMWSDTDNHIPYSNKTNKLTQSEAVL